MGRAISLARSEVLVAALLAASGAAFLLSLGLPAGDAPAHLYRTLLVREGFPIWDNLWYAGQYPLVSYSLLYYLPAALVGNVPLVVAATIVSAALFASLVTREWGRVGVWPARTFALVAAGPLFTGTYSYALGLAALLGTMCALQAGRTWLAVALAALTLGFSPLAFVFLCLALGALALARRRLDRRVLVVGASVALLAVVQLALLRAFPADGAYPFRMTELFAVLGVLVLGVPLAARSRAAWPLAALFALWPLASLLVFAVDSPVGENVTRLRALLFPLVLLGAALVGFRPRWLAAGALAAAFAYNLIPYLGAGLDRADGRPARQEFWAPALAFLERHSSAEYRVEVVPTLDHWEAYWVPRAGFALARGWYRQLDMAQNRVLYRKPLRPAVYRAWLRRMGVRYVVLPNTGFGHKGAEREALLLRSGRSGLLPVFDSREATIYELPRAVPILTGPEPAAVTSLGHSRIEGWTAAPGDYMLRVRYTPYWQLHAGAVCLRSGPGGMTRLTARQGGRFAVSVAESPAALVKRMLARGDPGC